MLFIPSVSIHSELFQEKIQTYTLLHQVFASCKFSAFDNKCRPASNKRLGSKAVIMFFTGTVGIVLGGPLSILLASMIAPDLVGGQGPEAVWRGFATVAGSWIGGGANQAAMKEIFDVGDSLFSAMIAIDVIVANIWMALLLYGTGVDDKINKWFDADVSSIDDLKLRMEQYKEQIMRIPETNDTIKVLAIGFGITGLHI